MRDVLEYLHSLSFDVPSFTPDGKLYRFGRGGSKDSAWYVGWQNSRLNSGEFYYVVCFGDWRTGEAHVYKPDKMSRAETMAIDEQIRQKQAEIQKEKERVQLEVADKAEKRFAAAKKLGSTPYMEKKLIPQLYGCCIYEDRLQIPMRCIDGVTWSLQTILADGQKLFMKGGRKKGTFHTIGAISEGEPFYVCEGFATASSIHQATGKGVVVAFDAGNLLEVAAALGKAYTKATIIICGDDDRGNPDNPGRKKAEKAGLLTNGSVVFPKFPAEDTKSTDFNDLHVRYGLNEVKAQLVEQPHAQEHGFIPLGYDAATHFFYHVPSKDIVTASTFTAVQMYRIAHLDYWEARYPTKKGTADLSRASHDLIQLSSAVGPFDSTRIRGTGVWMDDGRVVINTGHSLIVDGKEMSLSALSSWHIYIQTRNRMPPIHPRPYTAEEGKKLTRICEKFKWQNPNDAMQLVGWLMIARVAAALPIRPHVWLTGGKGTGKSTLMEQVIAPMLGSPKGKIHLIGATTEAGIRQAIKASALPVIFDEFESTGKYSRDRVDSIIELMRSAWSASQGKIIKGSSGGSFVEYQLAFCGLVSSIRVRLGNDADRSRFSILELSPHGDNPEQWDELRQLIAYINGDEGERLFARACARVPNILADYEMLAPELSRVVSQRYGQQVGMTLAGWWNAENDAPLSKAQARSIAEDFSRDDEVAGEKSGLTDEQECLMQLSTKRLTLRHGNIMDDMLIGAAVQRKDWHEALKHYGIKVKDGRILVANKHRELELLYQGSRWEGNWSNSLRRLPGALIEDKTSFGSRESKSRAVSIPIALFAAE